YGATGNLVTLTFAGQQNLSSSKFKSTARQVFASIDNSKIPTNPGLYEVSVTANATSTPPLFPTVITNTAVQPSFASAPVGASVPLNALTAGQNLAPSAMALNSVAGYAVILEQASNTMQLVDLTGNPPVQLGNPVPLGGSAANATDIAIDPQLQVNGGDLGIVVSGGDSTLYLYSFSRTSSPFAVPVKSVSVDLRTLTGQPNATGLPAPVSFGVDPSTHLGVVAYAST